MGAATVCWQCGQPVGGLFCEACTALQVPPADYYELFGIPPRLALDSADLEKRFYALSRRLHPDLFTRKPEQERGYSLDAAAVLNDAHRVLRDPVTRAEYVLRKHGFDIGEQRSKDVPPELLEEVFELNMALEELRSGDEDARPQLESARDKFHVLRDEIDDAIEKKFLRYDADGARATLAEIRGLLNRRRYIQNLAREVEKELTADVHVSD
ncbi:MAG: Fe-S protein assembly co-chaperone HscB [Bryobacteraceae bacterium]